MLVEMDFDIHDEIAASHTGEYIEAAAAAAVEIMTSHKLFDDSLAVINRRKIAVLLNGKTNRGVVVPAALIDRMLEESVRVRLQAWLESPNARFWVMQFPGNWPPLRSKLGNAMFRNGRFGCSE